MKTRYTLRAAALASTCLLPIAVFAADAPEYRNEATLGVRYQSSDSALAGRYSGYAFDGAAGVGSFKLNYSDPWDSGGVRYFKAQGEGISIDRKQLFPNASLSFKYGEQGKWGVNVYYDGIPYWQSLTFHSLNTSSGGLHGALPYSILPSLTINNSATPAGGVPAGIVTNLNYASNAFTGLTTNAATGAVSGGATAAQLANAQNVLGNAYALVNAGNTVQAVGTQRDIIGGGGSVRAGSNWTFAANLRHEHKQGTKENSLPLNTTTNVNYIPEPVNYDTDSYTVSAKYNDKQLQGLVSYTFSDFTDNLLAFNGVNPFIPATSATSFLPANYRGFSYALPPSNNAHIIKGQIAYYVTPVVRLSGNFGYTSMQQNEAFPLAYVGAAQNPYLPSSTNAQAENIFTNVAVSAKPFTGADFHAAYTYDKRNNDTTRYFVPNVTSTTVGILPSMVTADLTGSQHAPIANLPVSVQNQIARIDAGYQILPSTKISLNYTYNDKQRDYSVTNHNHENIMGAKVISSFGDHMDGMLGYAFGAHQN